MSQLVLLLLPAPADLDAIRACLGRRWRVNKKVEGLGEAEELHVDDGSGRRRIFESGPWVLPQSITDAMTQRNLHPPGFRSFWVRYGGGTSTEPHVAQAMGGWLYDSSSRLLTPGEFTELSCPPPPPAELQPLTPETRRRLELLFAPADRAAAEEMLVLECGNNLFHCSHTLDSRNLERFHVAALKLSSGSLHALRGAITPAKSDWRDLLMAAGFGEDVHAHEQWLAEGE